MAWNQVARDATRAIHDAAQAAESGDSEHALVDRAAALVLEFRKMERTPDEREDAYATTLSHGIKALRLIERSHELLIFTRDPGDEAGSASAGLMIGKAALAQIMRALDALDQQSRDLDAEAAIDRLMRHAFATAQARVDYLYKLAAQDRATADESSQP